MQPAPLPTGMVTFLFTDIENSTRVLNRVGERYGSLLTSHHTIIRNALAANSGIELNTEGDAFFAVFETATEAVTAAIDAQLQIAGDDELVAEALKVRMGVHCGEATLGGDNYIGIDVHIAARIAGASNGGQILVSETAAQYVSVPRVDCVPLGEFWLRDIDTPVGISQVVAPGLDNEVARPSAAQTRPVNAPVDLSSFVGRDGDIDAALSMLDISKLVTLTGPGGTGKTRLSVEIGTAASRMFNDGVFFVPLAGIADPASVPNSIADAIGAANLDPSAAPIDSLCSYLRNRQVLVIADNFEHVLEAAPYVRSLLEASPASKVLATSRNPLGLRGEREMAVAPLDVGTSAIELFAERASEVKSTFVLDDSNIEDISELVRRLDGLPLAIELAAARVRMMTPSGILQTLDPLTLARTGSSEDRELTLADTIRWSYDLLSPAEQTMMARMGVFPTGANLAQIDAVCQSQADLELDPFVGIGSLVEHSLVVGDEVGGEPRFRMLETIREFAVRRLSESADETEIRGRHTRAYRDVLETARPHLDGPASAQWMMSLGLENTNIQTAFAHAVESEDADAAQRIVSAAWRFWQSRGHLAEGTVAARDALALEGSTALVRAEALDAAGSIAYWTGDADATRDFYEEAVQVRRRAGETAGLANALYNLSFPLADTEGVAAATLVLDEAVDLATELGDERTLWLSYVALSRSWLETNPLLSREYADQAIVGAKDRDDPVSAAWALSLHAAASHSLGEYALSTSYLQSALREFQEIGDFSGIAVNLTGIAENARRLGDDVLALYLVGVVLFLREETGIGVKTAIDETVREFSTPESIEVLSDELKAAYEEGRAVPLNTAIDAALEWNPN